MTAPKLTNTQIFVLRRMKSGTSYSLRGDGKKGHENRPEIAVRNGQWYQTVMPYNAPSIPVLYRRGLVDFVSTEKYESTRWYRIQLTAAGHDAANTLKTTMEGNQ